MRNEQQSAEVEWYRANGLYPNRRIEMDGTGVPFVVGDWAWHRDPANPIEYIEKRMPLVPIPERALRRV